ncbi:MAG TPA: glycerol kinase GlpK [Deltaproteobacteria bacterium]|jgi:glycerol kinase|nr:glycerol kinase GlpK [Deltaproteobacteria bacterium]HQI01220.1 glycerol kinase GlpK [Deltaproteobacteria bacterium]
MDKYIMAIDQGTTGTRVMLIDASGKVAAKAYSEFPQIYPQPGWVEHDPEVIWNTTLSVMKQALSESSIQPSDIIGIGITNQRETTVLWEKDTIKPVHNAIVWQCRRSASICDELKARGHGPLFQEKTGLIIDAYFSGTKVKWLFDNVPGLKDRARKGEIAFGTIDTWLIAKLTGGRIHATDHTNASRTLLFNIHEKKWDRDILALLDIPPEILPEVVNSAEIIGNTDPEILGGAIPISGIAGDQQAALFGQGCFLEGEAKNTYGTGCFLLLNVGDTKVVPKSGLILTLACDENGKPCYALEGSIFIAGAVIQWLRDGLGLIENASQTARIASSVEDTHGVYMVPAFAGLGAPYWDMYARGAILGLTRSTTKAHIVRAALEGIAYQVKDLVSAFEESTGMAFSDLKVDGGASLNDFLMQFQADITGFPIDRSQYIESTGMGAAFLAGIATGFWKPGQDIKRLRKSDKRFLPRITDESRQTLYNGWLDAISRVKTQQP